MKTPNILVINIVFNDLVLNDKFNNIRYTFSTLALRNGVDIKTLSGILGYFSAGFTLDTYTHVTTEAQVSTVNKMGELIRVKIG